MENTTRAFDRQADKEMTAYTVETLFPYLAKRGIKATINTVRELQWKGVDYVFEGESGRKVYVDEKSQLHYLNNNINTYCLEVGMYNKMGEHIKGWFIDDKNITELYLLVYPNAEGKTYKDVKKEDFDSVEYLLVPKKEIKKYLEAKGLTEERLCEEEDYLRAVAMYDNLPRARKEVNGVRMTVSLIGRNGEPMAEQPCNIVLPKEVYESLAILQLETYKGNPCIVPDMKLCEYFRKGE